MEQAIKIAIENGYKLKQYGFDCLDCDKVIITELPFTVTLDPLFWQALGKGLGWKEYPHTNIVSGESKILRRWLEEWHRFIDHLAEGKDIESFFTNLLK